MYSLFEQINLEELKSTAVGSIINKFGATCIALKPVYIYRIWCGVNRLCDSGVHPLGDTSAVVNPAGQLLLTRRGKTRMDGVGIVFEFCITPL